MSVIDVKNLSKSYGKILAVDDISFDVKEGEIFGLIGLVIVVSYMIGFGILFSSQGFAGASVSGAALSLKDFGLQLGLTSFVVLGALLFLSILFSLAISLLLGIFAEDTKNAQVVIAPVMILVMIPYYLFMFLDFGSMVGLQKILVMLDPFSYAVLAPRELMFGKYETSFIGMGYLAILIGGILFLLVRIFNTDKILTAKFNFSKRKHTT